MAAHIAALPKTKRVEIWFQDEARLGQKNGHARIWAKTGTRPRRPADQRYANAYLFGAICPMGAKGAALMLSFANTRAMQMHLNEISCNVAAKAHGVVLMDRAGWHSTDKLKVPKNLTIILLPSRSPELNPVENIWQYLRQNWLSNRVFEDYDAIIEGRLPSLEQAHQSAPNNHVHQIERVGSQRSIIPAVGIIVWQRSP